MTLQLSLFGRAPMFLIGGAAAWVYVQYGGALRAALGARIGVRFGGADLAFLTILTGLAYLLRWVVSIGPADEINPPWHAWHVPEALLWSALVLLPLVAPLRLKPLVSNSVLNHLGVLSYSMYIWHVPLFIYGLQTVFGIWRFSSGWNLQTAVIAVFLSVLCLGLSELTYRFIERPFLTRKQRIGV